MNPCCCQAILSKPNHYWYNGIFYCYRTCVSRVGIILSEKEKVMLSFSIAINKCPWCSLTWEVVALVFSLYYSSILGYWHHTSSALTYSFNHEICNKLSIFSHVVLLICLIVNVNILLRISVRKCIYLFRCYTPLIIFIHEYMYFIILTQNEAVVADVRLWPHFG